MLSNNSLALILYIKDYAKKEDYSQYQHSIKAAFVKKVYKAIKLLDDDVSHVTPGKFAFRAFNCVVYN